MQDFKSSSIIPKLSFQIKYQLEGKSQEYVVIKQVFQIKLSQKYTYLTHLFLILLLFSSFPAGPDSNLHRITDCHNECLHLVTHPEDSEVEDDDGHEADNVHPELLAAGEARAIRYVTAGHGGQVNWR